MSKYTEAIAYISGNEGNKDFQTVWDTIYEALEIADRLEQAIIDEQTADCIIVDAECVNNKHDKEVWLNGYNQALIDIRGNNNDGV